MVGPDEDQRGSAEGESVPGKDLQPAEGPPGRLLARDVMARARDDHSAALELPLGRFCLADVMVQGGEEEGHGPVRIETGRPAQAAGLVDGELGVVPDGVMAEIVLLGVEDRVLDDERQGVELGKELAEGPELEELVEARRGAVRAEDLEELLGHPLDAQPGEVDRLG